MAPRLAPWSDAAWRLLRLARKELNECLRDRRTILTLVLMPVLLYPLLAMVFQQVVLHGKVEREKRVYRIAFTSEAEGNAVIGAWSAGTSALLRRQGQASGPDQPPQLPSYLDPAPEIRPKVVADPEAAVRAGDADLGVRVHPPGGFEAVPGRPLAVQLELLYRTNSTYGPEAVRFFEIVTGDVNALVVGRMLHDLGRQQRGDPIRVRGREVPDETGKGESLIPVLIPLILILMTMTGAVYPAIDLTAGERERNTLEILIAAPIPRLAVLLAKYIAVLTVAMLTALVNLGSMALTLQATGIGPALFGPALRWEAFAQVLGLLVLFAAFFSALLLALTSFARSFKEAQAYIVPLMLLCFAPGMMVLLPGLSLNGPLAVVPLVNIVLLARDTFAGTAAASSAAIVVLATLLYALAAVALAARLFGAEAVLSSEAGGWADLFGRPREPRPVAEPATALLCLALMFPIYFYLNLGLARTSGLDLSDRLLLAALGQFALFGVLPLLMAWYGRVRLRPGFGLRAAPRGAFVAALLLGLSVWPFVHELILLQNRLGVYTLRPELAEKLREAMDQWREHSPLLLVGVLGLLPAILEELFFRGYLLGALRGAGKEGRAVVVSSLLFALFHLLVTDSLAVERLLPSLLLGLLLGWLAVRGGSVFPGMLLHAAHNSLVVLLGYYQADLVAAGWLTPDQERLPVSGLLIAGVLAAAGLAWLVQQSSAVRRVATGTDNDGR